MMKIRELPERGGPHSMIKEEVGGLLAWASNYQSADVNYHGLWRFSTHQCLGLHIIPAVGNCICGAVWKSGFVFATEVKTPRGV